METRAVAPEGASELAGRRLLVTGGAGFLGARVVRSALRRGAHVTVMTRTPAPAPRLTNVSVARVVADVADADAVLAAFVEACPDLVVHAAGWPHWRQDPAITLPMMRVHATGTACVLEAARKTAVRRTVLVGTAGEYGDAPGPVAESHPERPIDTYSSSKLAATELGLVYDQSFRVPCTIVRPFVLYGPGEPPGRLFPSLFGAALRGASILDLSPGEQIRDFVHVDDVAEAILVAATDARAAGAVINLGTGVGVRLRDAAIMALSIAGSTVEPRFGALPYRPGEPPVLVADAERARALLLWDPMDLRTGLTSYWRSLAPSEP